MAIFFPNCQSGSDMGQMALHRVRIGPRLSRTISSFCQCWLSTWYQPGPLPGSQDMKIETQCLLLRGNQITETNHKQIGTIHCNQCCWRRWREEWTRKLHKGGDKCVESGKTSGYFPSRQVGGRAFQGKWLKLSGVFV